jgi:enoyl-CoA hydratase/carnithine racemase
MTPTSPSSPLLHIHQGVATLTLNRPAQRNRLEDADLRTLLAQFEQINDDRSVRVAVLTANTAGQPRPVFCAGYHIGGFDEPGHDPQFFERIPNALAELRPVTVCALNGSVYGGATDLVLACDLRLGLRGIEWRMPATALGLHYYPHGLQRYVSRFGLAAAKRAFLSARPFSDQQLEALGIFEAMGAPEEWPGLLQQLLDDIKALAPMAVQETKRSLNEIARGELNLPALRAREERTAQSADFREGRAAFAERRTPVFRSDAQD